MTRFLKIWLTIATVLFMLGVATIDSESVVPMIMVLISMLMFLPFYIANTRDEKRTAQRPNFTVL